MNWGKGIALALGLFIVFIVVMVVGFFSHKVDLESEDYYQREIAYEEEITSLNNVNELKIRPEVSLSETHLIVEFDAEHNFSQAQLMLKRPDNQKEDKLYSIEGTKTFMVDKNELVQGIYNAELSYSIEGKNYLQKKEIYI